ncbi:MAG: metallophosphoesterase [Solirubrobacterales bacterium]|nr:metallophosphoesterase [Solirubrobacterales bacterium]
MSSPHRLAPAFVLLVSCVALTALMPAQSGAADPAGPTVTVAAAGDISCPADMTEAAAGEFDDPEVPMKEMRCQGERVDDLIAAADPDIVLALGDLIQSQPSTTRAYDDFDATWGKLRGKIMPTIGNHDYLRQPDGSLAPSGYFDYWTNAGTPRWRIGAPDASWSSWNTGTWHMVNLNSNCNRVDCTFSGPQLRWLLKDLKANRQNPGTQCTMAYLHHPRFSAGIELGRTGDRMLLVNIWELLYRYRVDVVVTGHQHFYQRYLPQDPDGEEDPSGLTQFITGTGGASTFPTKDEDGNRARNSIFSKRGLGATFFTLGPDSYSWEFRDIEGNVWDQSNGETPCHSPNEGADRRAPRIARYAAHMARMRHLDGRVRKLNQRIRKLTRRKAVNRRIRPLRVTLRKVTRVRAGYRVKTLY